MRTLCFASLLALICSCGSDNGGTLTDGGTNDGNTGCAVEPTFTSIHDDLLTTTRCAIPGCHASTVPQADLDYQAGKQAVYDELLTTGTFNTLANGQFPNRVVANDPASSYLYVKVSETNPPGGGSGRMPPGLPLADCEIQAIQEWIQNGAMND